MACPDTYRDVVDGGIDSVIRICCGTFHLYAFLSQARRTSHPHSTEPRFLIAGWLIRPSLCPAQAELVELFEFTMTLQESKGKSRTVAVSGMLLGLINLVAIAIGYAWDNWTHRQHPFAAQIPLGTIVTVAGFLFYFRAALTSTSRSAIQNGPAWRQLYFTSLGFGSLGFGLTALLLPQLNFSISRMFTFFVSQAFANACAICVVSSVRDADHSAKLRSLFRHRWFRLLLKVSMALSVAAFAFVAVEGTSYLLISSRPAGPSVEFGGEYSKAGAFYLPDQRLGAVALPNLNLDCQRKVNGNDIWDVTYHTDQFGRRVSTILPSADPKQFAIFFGCSFLFGEGANDDQTIPSSFAAKNPEFRPYNYGIPGYGTQQMLAKLETGTLRQEVSEEDGVGLYLYLEDIHEARAVGTMEVLNAWASTFPCYEIKPGGGVVNHGSFVDARPLLLSTYHLLGKSNFVQYMGISFPTLSDRHYALTAEIVAESQRQFKAQMGVDRFCVIVFPKRNAHRKLLPHLHRLKVPYIDCSDLFDPEGEGFKFVGDGHPTPKANELLIEHLGIDLNKLFASRSPEVITEQ